MDSCNFETPEESAEEGNSARNVASLAGFGARCHLSVSVSIAFQSPRQTVSRLTVHCWQQTG